MYVFIKWIMIASIEKKKSQEEGYATEDPTKTTAMEQEEGQKR